MEPSTSSSPAKPQLPLPSAFVGSASGTARSETNQASQHREQLRAKRRVPPSQRRRAQMSCDACKTKRCKCVRLWPSHHGPGEDGAAIGNDELPPCKLCVETGITCTTSMPRKQRVYGSVEDLDKRYRALEALVAGVFPSLGPKSSAEELVAFGRGMGVTMPDFVRASNTRRTRTTQATTSSAQESTTVPTGPSISRTHQKQGNPELVKVRAMYLDKVLPRAYGAEGSSSQEKNSGALPNPSLKNVLGSENENKRLILDPSGWPHYVGPCGAFTFFMDVRELAARRSVATKASGKQVAGGQQRGIPRLGRTNPSIDEPTNPGRFFADIGYGRPGWGIPPDPVSRHTYLGGDSPPPSPSPLPEVGGSGHPGDIDYQRHRKLISDIVLPPRSQADTCVNAYFRRVHPNFIIFHRGWFYHAYNTLWRAKEAWDRENMSASTTATNPAGQLSVSAGWLCCLYMMFVFGSRSLLQDAGSLAFQRCWFGEVERLLPLSAPSLVNVQAYMLLSLYHYNITNDRTSAWTFHGAACRLAVAQGMHCERVARSFGPSEPLRDNLRRRVWWSMYQYEQFLCCSLGRPSAIDDREMDVDIPNDDFLEGNLLLADHLKYAVKLDMLHAAVRRELYDPAATAMTAPSTARALEFLIALSAWEEALPPRLRPVSAAQGLDGNEHPWRSVHLLYMRQQDTLGFLTRPFLLRTVQRRRESAGGEHSGTEPEPDAAAVERLCKVCITSAVRCGESIAELSRAALLNGVTWLDVFFVHVSSVVISLALLSPNDEREHDFLFFSQGGAGDDDNDDDDDDDYISTAETLVPWSRLIREHTRDEIVAAGRQLYEILTTMEMCGTSARYAKKSVDLAKAVGIVDGAPSIPESPSSWPNLVPNLADIAMNLDPSATHRRGSSSTSCHQFSGGVEVSANQGMQGMAGTNMFPIPGPAESSQLGRAAFTGNPNFGMGSNTQGDMILSPSQWDAGGSTTIMESIWLDTSQNSWGNPNQYHPPT
ncbi:fungal-specific transcription factor domain-containing protein [Camillea tinctor]|nr:fungal-specific transcription factor domain-containing protein [Camillea tinctor]